MGVDLVSCDGSTAEESGSTEVTFEHPPQPKAKSKRTSLKKKIQDLYWSINVLHARSKKDEEEKDILMKKNEHLQERVSMYEGYWKKYKLQEKALVDLRKEAEELRTQHESDSELLKEMDEALAYRIKEVDELNLSAKMMSNHIKQLEGQLVASQLVEMEEAEEPRGSQRRSRSVPPRPEWFDREEEATKKRAQLKAIIKYPVELEPQEENEEYEQWAHAQIIRLREGAISINRWVRDLREGSAEAVRLRLQGIAGN